MIKSIATWRKVGLYGLLILGLSSCATPANIAVLQKDVKERPEDFSAHLELAKAYLEEGLEWEGAPGVGTPVLISKRWLKKAQKELEKAMELDPLSPEPHYWLKVIYIALEKYKAADEEVALFNRLTARKKGEKSK